MALTGRAEGLDPAFAGTADEANHTPQTETLDPSASRKYQYNAGLM